MKRTVRARTGIALLTGALLLACAAAAPPVGSGPNGPAAADPAGPETVLPSPPGEPEAPATPDPPVQPEMPAETAGAAPLTPDPADSPPIPRTDPQPGDSGEAAGAESPAPDRPVPDSWLPLHAQVQALAATFSGRLSVAAVNLTTGDVYEYRAADRYHPASTFKLPVMLCVVDAIDAGELAWDTVIEYTPRDHDDVGAGAFATAPFGTWYPVENLVYRSLVYSNNVAVRMLASTLTWEGLWDCTTRIGGPVTRTDEGSTPVSARDEVAWWRYLWQMHQERPDLAETLLQPLREVTYRGRIVAGTPVPHLVTHKFGSYDTNEHDGAIVWGDRPYILVVMTHGAPEWEANEAIATIAGAAWAAVYAEDTADKDL